MSIFKPKYKITGRLTGGQVVYDVYFREYWFIFPYWEILNTDDDCAPVSSGMASVLIQSHTKRNESGIARFNRIR